MSTTVATTECMTEFSYKQLQGGKENVEVKEDVSLSPTTDGPPKPMNDSAYEEEEEEEEEEDEEDEEAQSEGKA